MYQAFQKKLKEFPVFSTKDIHKCFPDFDNRRLVEWQKKAYIQNIRRGYYRFLDKEVNEFYLYFASNKIYAPSYISLESAFQYYNLIPEAVFTITAISTKNTASYHTPLATFKYSNIKENLFWGYEIKASSGYTFKIAGLEKAILDYLYLKHSIHTLESIEALRWNKDVLKKIDKNLLNSYLKLFNSQALNHRIEILKAYIDA